MLAADKLMRSPRLYATFLLWMLSELFEHLPEVGDLDKPKLVFFFDEAHLLFDSAPKALLTAIEQVVRLIRSKGVGVYFVTQNPLDVPETVLGQLGNRVQHALRAFTPRDQRAVKAAADTFRQNPAFDTAAAIMQLGVGEALVSMLDEKGTPEMVARSLIAPPSARVGPVTPQERQEIIKRSSLLGKYDTAIDRESAFEVLQGAAKAGWDRRERRSPAQRRAMAPHRHKVACSPRLQVGFPTPLAVAGLASVRKCRRPNWRCAPPCNRRRARPERDRASHHARHFGRHVALKIFGSS